MKLLIIALMFLALSCNKTNKGSALDDSKKADELGASQITIELVGVGRDEKGKRISDREVELKIAVPKNSELVRFCRLDEGRSHCGETEEVSETPAEKDIEKSNFENGVFKLTLIDQTPTNSVYNVGQLREKIEHKKNGENPLDVLYPTYIKGDGKSNVYRVEILESNSELTNKLTIGGKEFGLVAYRNFKVEKKK